MIRFILIGGVGAGIVYFILKLCKSPKGNWKEPAKLLVPLLALVLLLFVLTGKAHLLGIMLAGLVPFLKNIAPYLLRFGPDLMENRRQKQHQTDSGQQSDQTHHSAVRTGAMTRAEAAKVLGLGENPSTEEIKTAHRKLMQKIHPDHGGSDYLASKLNEAKKTLLG